MPRGGKDSHGQRYVLSLCSVLLWVKLEIETTGEVESQKVQIEETAPSARKGLKAQGGED